MAHTIPDAAAKVANDKVLVDVYKSCDKGKQDWFFTKNKHLSSAASKPALFPSEKKFNTWWRELHPSAKHILYTYADFWFRNYDKVSKDDYDDIKVAYQKWPSGYYVVYYGAKIWACNLFVGETLYTYGRNIIKNGKYYSAHEIWEGFDPFTKVKKTNLKAGHIAAFEGHHVEIVTSVDLKNGTFCSRGAGRGDDDGIELCAVHKREIQNKDIKFFHI